MPESAILYAILALFVFHTFFHTYFQARHGGMFSRAQWRQSRHREQILSRHRDFFHATIEFFHAAIEFLHATMNTFTPPARAQPKSPTGERDPGATKLATSTRTAEAAQLPQNAQFPSKNLRHVQKVQN